MWLLQLLKTVQWTDLKQTQEIFSLLGIQDKPASKPPTIAPPSHPPKSVKFAPDTKTDNSRNELLASFGDLNETDVPEFSWKKTSYDKMSTLGTSTIILPKTDFDQSNICPTVPETKKFHCWYLMCSRQCCSEFSAYQALEMLGPRFTNSKIRNFAIEIIEKKISKDEFQCVLPIIVHSLR
jgi:hypothetical protein